MRTLLLTLCVIVAGCADTSESNQETPSVRTTAEAPDADTVDGGDSSDDSDSISKTYAGLTFSIPEGWQDSPPKFAGIIAGELKIPEAGASVSVTLSRAGGAIDDNLGRWRGQFNPQSRDEIMDNVTVAGVAGKRIDLQGDFHPGFGRTADGEWRMIGVVAPLGQENYFIKLTGPVDEVSAVKDEFDRFVRSAVQK